MDWSQYLKQFIPGAVFGFIFGVFYALLMPARAAAAGKLLFAVEFALAFGVLGLFLARYLEVRQRVYDRVRRELEEEERAQP